MVSNVVNVDQELLLLMDKLVLVGVYLELSKIVQINVKIAQPAVLNVLIMPLATNAKMDFYLKALHVHLAMKVVKSVLDL